MMPGNDGVAESDAGYLDAIAVTTFRQDLFDHLLRMLLYDMNRPRAVDAKNEGTQVEKCTPGIQTGPSEIVALELKPFMAVYPLASSALFGQVTLEDLSRGFRERSTVLPITMAIVLVAVSGMMLVLLFLAVRRERRGKLYSRPKLFKELCQAHQLHRSEKRLLRELAVLSEAEGPELLFVRRDLLARGAFRWRQAHPGSSDESIRNLRQKLYAAEPDPAATETPAAEIREDASA